MSKIIENGYEKLVWRTGPYDWHWKVRHGGASVSFDSGNATSRTDANNQIARSIERREAQESANWRPV